MTSPLFQGIVSGIGKSAVYIYGFQRNTLFFLDPHYVQSAGNDGYYNPPSYEVNIEKVDNSMIFAMICYTKEDHEVLLKMFNMPSQESAPVEMETTDNIDGFEVLSVTQKDN